jgi:hypothetical protein
MKIKYYLTEIPMTPDPDDRKAQVTDYETVTEKELVEYMTRPGSGITPAEAKGNYDEIIGAFDYFLKQGYGIITEFLIVRPTMPGVYRNMDDKFDSARHKIAFKARLGRRYNKTADDVKTEKVTPVSNIPVIYSVEDITSGVFDESITSGGVISLKGLRLKFKQDDPQQGIFLIASDKTEYRAEKILSHTGALVVCVAPILPADDYTLELRVLPQNNKTIRKGKFPDKLSV